MTFKVGDKVRVIRADSDWWFEVGAEGVIKKIEVTARNGIVGAVYLVSLPEKKRGGKGLIDCGRLREGEIELASTPIVMEDTTAYLAAITARD